MAAGRQSTPWIVIRTSFILVFFTVYTAIMLVPICLLGLLRMQNTLHHFGRLWAKGQVWAAGVQLERALERDLRHPERAVCRVTPMDRSSGRSTQHEPGDVVAERGDAATTRRRGRDDSERPSPL